LDLLKGRCPVTHSLLPWTAEVPPLTAAHGAHLKSADGKHIAYFLDHRDADLVLAALDEKEKRTIEELKDQIDDLEAEIKADKAYIKVMEKVS
jgi:hypothetical protein